MKKKKKTQTNIVRYKPNIHYGLTEEQIKEREKDNLLNYDSVIPTKTIAHIVSNNLFTLFNFLNLALGLAVFLVSSYKNLLFLGVVVCNTIISTFQEIRSKKIIDKLSLISATNVKAIRNGSAKMIKIDEIVLDDILEINAGNQVVSDAIVMDGSCEVNESFITGESDPIYKNKGDMLLSGSFIISGKCIVQVEHIGLDNYTSAISRGAKYIKKVNSELMQALKKVIKVVSIIIIPIGFFLFWKQTLIVNNTFEGAVVNTVAALIGMIPEGLILLTSTVLAVSVIRLSKHKVLVQELYCIETLARVDTLCVDKTGTITDGNMEVVDIFLLARDVNNIEEILSCLSENLEDNNATIAAIRKKYQLKKDWQVNKNIPFSSQRKFSGITFDRYGSYIIGAPEFVLKDEYNSISSIVDNYSKEYRVLLLAHSNYPFINSELPKNINPLCLILLKDRIRPHAIDTLKYFKEQGVDIKIISGDSVLTVANIASRIGFNHKNSYIDASTITNDVQLKDAVKKYTIFGRVSPNQKRDIIHFLKEDNHTVAMIGDGVNDVLALKEADCSISLASGSEASRNVSQLVLLDSNFDAMPMVVAEGRRTINNIERSATLFLVKTIYAATLAFIFLFVNMSYPFVPIQLTLTSVLTIGIPSFVLAIEPNHERIRGKFLTNVISRSLPTALTIVINIILIMIIATIIDLSYEQTSTLSVILTGYIGFMLLYKICMPFNNIRRALMLTMVSCFIIGIIGLRTLFSLTIVTPYMLLIIGLLVIIATHNFKLFTNLYYKFKIKHSKVFS